MRIAMTLQQATDLVATFVREECESFQDAVTPMMALHASYLRWAKLRRHPSLSDSLFGRAMTVLGLPVVEVHPGPRRARVGIRLRGAQPEPEPEPSRPPPRQQRQLHLLAADMVVEASSADVTAITVPTMEDALRVSRVSGAGFALLDAALPGVDDELEPLRQAVLASAPGVLGDHVLHLIAEVRNLRRIQQSYRLDRIIRSTRRLLASAFRDLERTSISDDETFVRGRQAARDFALAWLEAFERRHVLDGRVDVEVQAAPAGTYFGDPRKTVDLRPDPAVGRVR